MCIFALSLGIYFIYIWGSNYTGFSQTYYSMEMIFQSADYYLTVGVSVLLAYLLDIIIVSWQFELKTTPADFLRKIVNKKLKIELHEAELLRIFTEVRVKNIEEDIQREKQLEE